MQIGTGIKQFRKSRHIKQADLAAKCDITPAYLSQIEKGQKSPRPDVLQSIANALETSVQALQLLSFTDLDIRDDRKQLFNDLMEKLKPIILER